MRSVAALALVAAFVGAAMPVTVADGHLRASADASGSAGISFVSIGDWGGAALKDYHQTDELAVAKQFAATASTLDAKWVINVGDNMYYYGVWNTSDPQWDTDFEQVYTEPSMMVKWYSVLGNHDYGYNPTAQTQYKSPNSDRWVMPSRYYTERLALPNGDFVTFVFLDTNPCVSAYRADDPSGWDPCGSAYPAPADCQFHANILKEDCGTQYSWLQQAVAGIPKGDWKIGVGHHVADEIDVQDFVTVLQNAGFDMYMNGHSHVLEYYQMDSAGAYITTGAGCMVKISGDGEDGEDHEEPVLPKNGHSYNSVWTQKVAGFTTHTFSADYQTLTTNFLDYTGKTVYSVDVKKGQGPTPKPTDDDQPSTGSCAVYGCVYDSSHSCQCNSSCSSYGDCCSDYQKVCG